METLKLTDRDAEEAFQQGKLYGRCWRGDPRAALENGWEARIELVSHGTLIELRGGRLPPPGHQVCGLANDPGYEGWAWGERPSISLNLALSESEKLQTLAHELGHLVCEAQLPEWWFDCWGAGFLSAAPRRVSPPASIRPSMPTQARAPTRTQGFDFCPRCARRLPPAALACPACGKRL